MITLTYESLAEKLGIPDLETKTVRKEWEGLSAVFETQAKGTLPAAVYFFQIGSAVTESADFELSNDINGTTISLGFRANHATGGLDMTTYRIVRSLAGSKDFIYHEVNAETGAIVDEEAMGCVKSADKPRWFPDADNIAGQQRLLESVCANIKAVRQAQTLKLVARVLDTV